MVPARLRCPRRRPRALKGHLQRRLLREHVDFGRPPAGALPVLGVAHARGLGADEAAGEALEPLVLQLVAGGHLGDRGDEDGEVLRVEGGVSRAKGEGVSGDVG